MMNLAKNRSPIWPRKAGSQNAALRDYDSVRRAIALSRSTGARSRPSKRWPMPPAVTPDELHHLFRRWAGLTPKAFMQALTLDHAKGLLRNSASVLDAALDSGLSGPGRLHDLFVTHEAMSPGEWKNGGAGMTLRFGFHPSPFGAAIVIASGRGLAGLAFADAGEEAAALADMQRRWPQREPMSKIMPERPRWRSACSIPKLWRPDQPLRVVLIGTDFEVRVWETLLKIPMGKATICYSRHRCQHKKPERVARRRRSRRKEPGIVRGALPSRARQERRTDRLSLGDYPQASDDGLGGRAGRPHLKAFRPPYPASRPRSHRRSAGKSRARRLPVRA